jgi:hypothetical protein
MYSLRFWSTTGNGTKQHRRITGVEVFADGREMIKGKAVCCHLDQDDKLKGQKAALSNALEGVPDRNIRREIWGAFFTRSRRAKELNGN